jgi:hypothetical protein
MMGCRCATVWDAPPGLDYLVHSTKSALTRGQSRLKSKPCWLGYRQQDWTLRKGWLAGGIDCRLRLPRFLGIGIALDNIGSHDDELPCLSAAAQAHEELLVLVRRDNDESLTLLDALNRGLFGCDL